MKRYRTDKELTKREIISWLDELVELEERMNQIRDLTDNTCYISDQDIHLYCANNKMSDFYAIAEAVGATIKFNPAYCEKYEKVSFKYRGWEFFVMSVREV